ncbi:DUF4347 domain-containing protein, partial [Heliobacterium gestii]
MRNLNHTRPRNGTSASTNRVVRKIISFIAIFTLLISNLYVLPGYAFSGPREIVFIDNNVDDYQTLADGVGNEAEVHILDAAKDGLAQMANILSGRSDIDALHVLSHGAAAAVELGALRLTEETLPDHINDLKNIGSALRPGGDVLFYGCNIAEGEKGRKFIADVAAAIGRDVAASDDRTGSSDKKGNWQLEAATGDISTKSLSVQKWKGDLAIDTTHLIGNFYSTVPGEGLTGGVTVANDNDWHTYTLTFTATEANTAISFLFRNEPSAFFVDDFSVKRVGDNTELLINGGMEKGVVTGTLLNDKPSQPKDWSLIGTPTVNAGGAVYNDLHKIDESDPNEIPTIPYAKTGLFYWMDGAMGGFDGIQQVIPTQIGQTYTLSFALKNAGAWNGTQADTTGVSNGDITQVLVYAGGLPGGFTVTPAPVEWLSSVAGQTAGSAGGGDGSSAGSAITWDVNVGEAKGSLSLSDIAAAPGATVNLYSNAAFTTEVTGSDTIALTGGGATTAYIRVTSQDTSTVSYYAVTIHRPASSNAGLTSVAGQTGTPGGGTGADASHPITWSVNVAGAKGTLSTADIAVAPDATFKLFSNAGYTAEVTGSNTITLTDGGATTAYIKVTAQDTTTAKYYAVTINRAASDSTPP